MNAYVHETLTRRWATEVGFSSEEADAIARADLDVDRRFDGHRWRNKRYHFAWLGARRWARRWMAAAILHHDLVLLGWALHCEQDAVSHGWVGHLYHYPGIDIWDRRSPKVRERIEHCTKLMLVQYRDSACGSGEV